MALTDRLARLILDSDVPLERGPIVERLHQVVPTEAPLIDGSTVERVADSIVGMGPLEPLLADDSITDVLVNRPDEIWVERGGELERSSVEFADEASVLAAVERTIAPLGLRLDRGSPLVSARLSDGSRLHAAIPPVSVSGPVVAIRRFTTLVSSLADLVRLGTVSEVQADHLQVAVGDRRNIVVSGATGAGKTTFLNALASSIPDTERIVTIEDAAELDFPGHVVGLEARPPNVEGVGDISVADLLRAALRMRPDRIVVGEVRGAEALDMISAMNTGHDGSLSTVHANGPEDALWRLETLALMAHGPGELAVRRQLWSAVDLIVHLERRGGVRQVRAMAEVDPTGCREIEC